MIDLKKSAELNGMEPIELYNWFKIYSHSNKRVICYCEECGIERNIKYQQYHILCRRCANNDPIKIKKRKDGFNEHYSHQENRDAQGERIKQHHIDHPETRVEMSKLKVEYFSHQENCDANSKRKTEYYSHQENRDAQAERTRQYAKDNPETPEMLIERSKRVSAGHQGIPYEEWEDFIYNQVSGRASLESKQWRSDILQRDNYTCQICYERDCILNAHHIRKWIEHPELRFNINNGITLCVECHFETYAKEDEYINFLEKRINHTAQEVTTFI